MDNSKSTAEPENTPTSSINHQQMADNEVICRRGPRRSRTHVTNISKDTGAGGGEELTDEKAEVEKKIVALQKIVPGGERLPVEALFEETAEYILELECQVKALRFLSALVQASENKKEEAWWKKKKEHSGKEDY
ncbi:hypothetical protein DH2020_022620 [Rehmannia glutinosa]|uniref:Uncharacterized protein n=1 Tax=Rehmannia glutinosa TaxID=99300 RepID=A0ABR0W7K8_REHGL